jgi:hypothetical protein
VEIKDGHVTSLKTNHYLFKIYSTKEGKLILELTNPSIQQQPTGFMLFGDGGQVGKKLNNNSLVFTRKCDPHVHGDCLGDRKLEYVTTFTPLH